MNIVSITLIFILIRLFINLITENRSNILVCGIFAYCGEESPSIDKLKILGLFNDDRGGDGIGISVDDDITKTAKTFHWDKWILNNDLPEPQLHNTFIGHTRKSTKGGVMNSDYNHPFDINGMIGCHNGTIYNTKELKRNYNVEKNIDLDSYILLDIMSRYPNDIPNILENYQGKAVLVWYFKEDPNRLFVFKGAAGNTEERSVFYYQTDSGIYISSIKDSLYAVGGNSENVFSFEPNKITIINNGKIENTKYKVNRPYLSSTYDNNFRSDFGYDEIFQQNVTSNSGYPKSNTAVDGYGNLIHKEPVEVEADEVYFCKTRYWRNGHLLHGLYIINTYTRKVEYESVNNKQFNKEVKKLTEAENKYKDAVAFFHGVKLDKTSRFFECQKQFTSARLIDKNKAKVGDFVVDPHKKLSHITPAMIDAAIREISKNSDHMVCQQSNFKFDFYENGVKLTFRDQGFDPGKYIIRYAHWLADHKYIFDIDGNLVKISLDKNDSNKDTSEPIIYKNTEGKIIDNRQNNNVNLDDISEETIIKYSYSYPSGIMEVYGEIECINAVYNEELLVKPLIDVKGNDLSKENNCHVIPIDWICSTQAEEEYNEIVTERNIYTPFNTAENFGLKKDPRGTIELPSNTVDTINNKVYGFPGEVVTTTEGYIFFVISSEENSNIVRAHLLAYKQNNTASKYILSDNLREVSLSLGNLKGVQSIDENYGWLIYQFGCTYTNAEDDKDPYYYSIESINFSTYDVSLICKESPNSYSYTIKHMSIEKFSEFIRYKARDLEAKDDEVSTGKIESDSLRNVCPNCNGEGKIYGEWLSCDDCYTCAGVGYVNEDVIDEEMSKKEDDFISRSRDLCSEMSNLINHYQNDYNDMSDVVKPIYTQLVRCNHNFKEILENKTEKIKDDEKLY